MDEGALREDSPNDVMEQGFDFDVVEKAFDFDEMGPGVLALDLDDPAFLT